MALIEGFEPGFKLTRLELRIEDFRWDEMTAKDIKFSAKLRKYQKNTVRADRFGRLLLRGMITRGTESGFYIHAYHTIQAIDEEQTPPEPTFEHERGVRLLDELWPINVPAFYPYIACDTPVFFVVDENTKTSKMALFYKPSVNYTFKTERLVIDRCGRNEQQGAFADLVVLVYDDYK